MQRQLGPAILTFLALVSSRADAASTARMSIGSAGQQGNGDSGYFSVAISSDGRFVAFQSEADNLVAGDHNDKDDVFVRDRLSRQTTRVSVSSAGSEANGESEFVAISADGRFVAFFSTASLKSVPNAGSLAISASDCLV